VLLARGQAFKSLHELLARQLRGFLPRHPFDEFRERGAAGERRRAAVGEKANGFDAFIAHAQTEAQAITADRVRSFSNRVCVRQLPGIARMSQMVFEDFRVRQDMVSAFKSKASGSLVFNLKHATCNSCFDSLARALGHRFLIER
jgi:hypothetical protein